MGGALSVIARWESKGGKRWVEVTRAGNGQFQWRTHALAARIGYTTLVECAARAALEAALMPGPPLKLVLMAAGTVSVDSRTACQ